MGSDQTNGGEPCAETRNATRRYSGGVPRSGATGFSKRGVPGSRDKEWLSQFLSPGACQQGCLQASRFYSLATPQRTRALQRDRLNQRRRTICGGESTTIDGLLHTFGSRQLVSPKILETLPQRSNRHGYDDPPSL